MKQSNGVPARWIDDEERQERLPLKNNSEGEKKIKMGKKKKKKIDSSK